MGSLQAHQLFVLRTSWGSFTHLSVCPAKVAKLASLHTPAFCQPISLALSSEYTWIMGQDPFGTSTSPCSPFLYTASAGSCTKASVVKASSSAALQSRWPTDILPLTHLCTLGQSVSPPRVSSSLCVQRALLALVSSWIVPFLNWCMISLASSFSLNVTLFRPSGIPLLQHGSLLFHSVLCFIRM